MTRKRIPPLDLAPEIDEHWDELSAAIQSVLRSGRFILGPQVEAFETEVAEYLGVAHAVGVNSGTDALVLALKALGLAPGDEVITTPFSFIAAAEAVCQLGGRPVFVDIDPQTFNLDPAAIEERVGPRTKAVIPVHLFGHAAPMAAICELAERHGLLVLEDAAQAFGGATLGRKLGRWGHAAAFSFFPTKNLGACGDAGLIATDDDAVAAAARQLRAHGARRKYFSEVVGYNSRLDELQAAILRVKLPHIDRDNDRRRRVARRYDELLGGLPGITVPPVAAGVEHVYHQYTIRVAAGRRDALRAALEAAGVGSMIYYPVPLHRLPVFAPPAAPLPRAEAAAAEVLSLPIWPALAEAQQERVVRAVRGFCEAVS